MIAELVRNDLWANGGEAWYLEDLFSAQLSAEEVAARREYDAIRQRIRFAKTPETVAGLRLLEDAAKTRLNAAREARRARESAGRTSESQPISHRESQRPVPVRSVSDPTRPAPHKGEVGERGRSSARLARLDGAAALDRRTGCYLCGKAIVPTRDTIVATKVDGVVHEVHEGCLATGVALVTNAGAFVNGRRNGVAASVGEVRATTAEPES